MEFVIRKLDVDCKINILFRIDSYCRENPYTYTIQGFSIKSKERGQKYSSRLPYRDDYSYRCGYKNTPPKRNYQDDCWSIVKKYLTTDEINDCLIKTWEQFKPKLLVDKE